MHNEKNSVRWYLAFSAGYPQFEHSYDALADIVHELDAGRWDHCFQGETYNCMEGIA